MGPTSPRHRQFEQLFADGKYYEAHEVLEEEWKHAAGSARVFLQGLIFVCGACVHAQKGNAVEAMKMARLAQKRLSESGQWKTSVKEAQKLSEFIAHLTKEPMAALSSAPAILFV